MPGQPIALQPRTDPTDAVSRCDRLRSLHVPGAPLRVANVWDVASAQAVVAAGFPVVGTTSAAIAAVLGYEDHQQAPREEMLAAAARITRAVEVPVTVDAEAGYGMDPAELVGVLEGMGAAGCNLEDTDHTTGRLRDPADQAAWLQAVRAAASAQDYPLVINARIDVFLTAKARVGRGQVGLVDDALHRAHAYHQAGADCLFPIALWQPDALTAFLAQAPGPVNILRIPPGPSEAELAELGVARISYGGQLHHAVLEEFVRLIGPLLRADPADRDPQP
jgi:2-methylisocitrate lyase-like PEP mutase family enzyme